ncbi:MAG: DUF2752 domain-containing protein [Planctomycetota bacterium]
MGNAPIQTEAEPAGLSAEAPNPDADAGPPAVPAWMAPPSWRARLSGLAVLLGGAAVLGVGIWLSPDTAGLGTHTQLGWSPCGFEGRTGLPCATCGMTTATTLAAEGRLLDSLRVQPAGFLFALLAALACLMGGWSAWTGRSLMPVALVLVKPKTLVAIGVAVLLAWGYRLADAMLGQPWTTLS